MQTITNLFGENEIVKAGKENLHKDIKKGFAAIIKKDGVLYFKNHILTAIEVNGSAPPKGITAEMWLSLAYKTIGEYEQNQTKRLAKKAKEIQRVKNGMRANKKSR